MGISCCRCKHSTRDILRVRSRVRCTLKIPSAPDGQICWSDGPDNRTKIELVQVCAKESGECRWAPTGLFDLPGCPCPSFKAEFKIEVEIKELKMIL